MFRILITLMVILPFWSVVRLPEPLKLCFKVDSNLFFPLNLKLIDTLCLF